MSEPLDSAGAVRAEVAALEADLAAADLASARARGGLADRLDGLRDRWREEPDAFDAVVLVRLRNVAARLREVSAATAPGTAPADPRAVLKEVFGHDAFRPGQEEIVRAVLAGRDCVGVMPTGAGKSLTYQLPARCRPGTALVVSPLIALMKDQVDAMARVGLRAAFLNSSLSPEERRERVRALRRGELEILYAAPEGLEASVGAALEGTRLSLIAVDEAHCISHWGHDFRPAYRNLAGLRARFGAPVLALTATATREVTRDIAAQLGMTDPLVVRGSFFRPNLRLHAVKKGEGPKTREILARLVRARRGESGIVYALSRKSVEETAEFLARNGVRAAAYHAGMEAEERTRVQDAFQAGAVDVVVATVAFGMGIDKPDIRFVIHRDMPRSVEAYYQEIGRAGRDGAPSDCVLLYSWADVISWDRLLDGSDEPEVAAWQKRQVRAMYRIADAEGCRHERLVGYFGERIAPCGRSCDACSATDVLAAAPAVQLARGKDGRRERTAAEVDLSEADPALVEALRALRTRLARAHGVPAYVIFPDSTLFELAAARPRDAAGLLDVKGIGPAKAERYGAEILAALRGRAGS